LFAVNKDIAYFVE